MVGRPRHVEASRARAHEAPAALALGGARQVLADYATLTKPRVQLLLLLTTVTHDVRGGRPVARRSCS